jgi:hypothetical protein
MRIVSRRIFLVLVAVFAMSAVTAVGASAYTNPILENAKGEHVSKVKFTGLSEAGGIAAPFRTVGGEKWECVGETATGELSTTGTGAAATTSGTVTRIFTGCESGLGNYTSPGRKVGEIEEKFSLSLMWAGKESEETPGWQASIASMSEKPGNGKGAKITWTCGVSKIKTEIEGAFISSTNKKLNEAFTKGTLVANQSNGVQQDKKYTEEGKEGENALFGSEGGGAFAEGATELQEEQAYGESVKIAKS